MYLSRLIRSRNPFGIGQALADFALQVPTVALALAMGMIATKRWRVASPPVPVLATSGVSA
jgi:hypothetical protein